MKGLTRWFRFCTGAESRNNLQVALAEAQVVLRVLEELLLDDLKTIDSDRLSKERYKDPSWPFFQADKNGESRAYRRILNLLKDYT